MPRAVSASPVDDPGEQGVQLVSHGGAPCSERSASPSPPSRPASTISGGFFDLPAKQARLTELERRVFVEWIDMGALWNGIPGPDGLPGSDSGGDR